MVDGAKNLELVRLRRRAERLDAENRFLTSLLALTHDFDALGPAVDDALRTIVEVTGAARGLLGLFPPGAQKAAWWRACALDGGPTSPDAFSRTVVQRALREGRTVHSTNLMESGLGAVRSIQRAALRQALCAPVGRPTAGGVLYLQDCAEDKAAFTAEDRRAVDLFCAAFDPAARRLAADLSRGGARDPSAEARGRLVAHDALVGSSEGFAEVLQEVYWANIFNAPPGAVLLLGPTGVGKSTLARLVHDNSPCRAGPFVAFNCANLPPERLDERLFGVRAKAFSGVDRWVGLVEEANGGSLFLDEVGELALGSQARLLTFLDTGRYRAAGADADARSSVRLIAATHRDPAILVQSGRLRLDFHARISENEIRIPPLHERPEDVRDLAEHLFAGAARTVGPELQLSAKTLDSLTRRDWPTGVRGLRKAIRDAIKVALRAGSPSVDPCHLSQVDPTASGDLHSSRIQAEREAIVAALDRAEGNRSEAAKILGIGRQHLHRRLKVLGIG